MIRSVPIWLVCFLIAAILVLIAWNPDLTIKLQVVTLLLVIAAPAMLIGGKATDGYWQRPNAWTWIYNACYAASFLLANSFWLVYWGYVTPDGVEESKWGASYVLALKFFTLHLFILFNLTLGLLLLSAISIMPKHDLQSILVLSVWIAAEIFGGLEYVECKIFEPYTVALAKTLGEIPPEYACQRALTHVAPFAAPFVTASALILFNLVRWKRIKG